MARNLDSFDAMTMNRPYHQGGSPGEALRRMEQTAHCYDRESLTQHLSGRQGLTGDRVTA